MYLDLPSTKMPISSAKRTLFHYSCNNTKLDEMLSLAQHNPRVDISGESDDGSQKRQHFAISKRE